VLNTNFSSGLTYSFIDYEDGLLTYRGKSGEKKFNLSIGDGFNLTLIINGVKKKYNISLDNGRYIVIDNYHDELKNLRQFKKRPIFD
jgi:hypothetical protein